MKASSKSDEQDVRSGFSRHWYWESIGNNREPTEREYDGYLANYRKFLLQAEAPAVHLTILKPGAVQISAVQRERFARLCEETNCLAVQAVAVVAPSALLRGAVMVFNWVVKKEPRPQVFGTTEEALQFLATVIPKLTHAVLVDAVHKEQLRSANPAP